MNPKNYDFYNYSLSELKKELLNSEIEFNKLRKKETTARRKHPLKQIQLEFEVSRQFVRLKTLRNYLAEKETEKC